MKEDGSDTNSVTSNVATDSQQSNCSMSLLIDLISSAFIKVIINHKNTIEDKSLAVDEFYSIRIPNMTIKEYLERIVKHSKMESSTLVMSFVLISNMVNEHNYILSLRNVYRLLLASAVICIKYNEDSQFNNQYYAKIGGLTAKEFNLIEYSFFIKIGCQIKINQKKYEQSLKTLIK